MLATLFFSWLALHQCLPLVRGDFELRILRNNVYTGTKVVFVILMSDRDKHQNSKEGFHVVFYRLPSFEMVDQCLSTKDDFEADWIGSKKTQGEDTQHANIFQYIFSTPGLYKIRVSWGRMSEAERLREQNQTVSSIKEGTIHIKNTRPEQSSRGCGGLDSFSINGVDVLPYSYIMSVLEVDKWLEMDMTLYARHLTHIPLPFPMTLSSFTLQPKLLPPGYFRICMMVVDRSLTFGVCAYVMRAAASEREVSETLIPVVTPRMNQFSWPSRELVLNASKSYHIYHLPESGYIGENELSFRWKCEGDQETCSVIRNNLPEDPEDKFYARGDLLPTRASVLTITNLTSEEGSKVKITLFIIATDNIWPTTVRKTLVKTISFLSTHDITPHLGIRCVINCLPLVNTDRPLLLQIDCGQCEDLGRTRIAIEWDLLNVQGWRQYSEGRQSLYFLLTNFDIIPTQSFQIEVTLLLVSLGVKISASAIFSKPAGTLEEKQFSYTIVQGPLVYSRSYNDSSDVLSLSRHRLNLEQKNNFRPDFSSAYPLIFSLHRRLDMDEKKFSSAPVLHSKIDEKLAFTVSKDDKKCISSCNTFELRNSGPFPHCKECNGYILCDNETLLFKHCVEGAFYNPVIKKCTFHHNQFCTSKGTWLYPIKDVIQKMWGEMKSGDIQKTKIALSNSNGKGRYPESSTLLDYTILRTISHASDFNLEQSRLIGIDGTIFSVFDIRCHTANGLFSLANSHPVVVEGITYTASSDPLKFWDLLRRESSYELSYLGPISRLMESGKVENYEQLIESIFYLLTDENQNPINYSNINLILVVLLRILKMELKDFQVQEWTLQVLDRMFDVHRSVRDDPGNDNKISRALFLILSYTTENFLATKLEKNLGDDNEKAYAIEERIINATFKIMEFLPSQIQRRYPDEKTLAGKQFALTSVWVDPYEEKIDIFINVIIGSVYISNKQLREVTKGFFNTFVEITVLCSSVSPLPKKVEEKYEMQLPVMMIDLQFKDERKDETHRSEMENIFDISFSTIQQVERKSTFELNVYGKYYNRKSTHESSCVILEVAPSSIHEVVLKISSLSGLKLKVSFSLEKFLEDFLDIFEEEVIELPRPKPTQRSRQGKPMDGIVLPKLTVRESYQLKGASFLIMVSVKEGQPYRPQFFKPVVYPYEHIGIEHFIIACSRHSCFDWDASLHKWSTKKCTPTQKQDAQKSAVSCRCNEGKIFSGSTIECERDYKLIKMSAFEVQSIQRKDIAELGWMVPVFVFAVWFIFLASLHWGRKRDKIEKQLGMVYALPGVYSPYGVEQYLICVVTGWWKACGTTSTPAITLVGTFSASSLYTLHMDGNPFEAGSEIWLLLSIPSRIGRLKSVMLSLHKLDDDKVESPWYVSHVFLRNLTRHEDCYSVFDGWIPHPINTQKRFMVKTVSEKPGSRKRMLILTFIRLMRDFHMFFGTVYNLHGSTYTKAQHMICSFCVVLLVMGTGLWQLGVPKLRLKADAARGERFYLTVEIFISGLLAAVYNLIPSFAISFLVAFAGSLNERRLVWKQTRRFPDSSHQTYVVAQRKRIMSKAYIPRSANDITFLDKRYIFSTRHESSSDYQSDTSSRTGSYFSYLKPKRQQGGHSKSSKVQNVNYDPIPKIKSRETEAQVLANNSRLEASRQQLPRGQKDRIQRLNARNTLSRKLSMDDESDARPDASKHPSDINNSGKFADFIPGTGATSRDTRKRRDTYVTVGSGVSLSDIDFFVLKHNEYLSPLDRFPDELQREKLKREKNANEYLMPAHRRFWRFIKNIFPPGVMFYLGIITLIIVALTYEIIIIGLFFSWMHSINYLIVVIIGLMTLSVLLQPVMLAIIAFCLTSKRLRDRMEYYTYVRKADTRMKARRREMLPCLKMGVLGMVESHRNVGRLTGPWPTQDWMDRSEGLCNTLMWKEEQQHWKKSDYGTVLTMLFIFGTVVIINVQSGSVWSRYNQTEFLRNLLQIGHEFNRLTEAFLYEDIWKHLLDNIHSKTHYSLDSINTTIGLNMLSAVRLRQIRVKPIEGTGCEKGDGEIIKTRYCSTDVDSGVIETRNFSGSWKTPLEGEAVPGPFSYNPGNASDSFSTAMHTYPPGGYDVTFSVAYRQADVLNFLKGRQWVDKQTRALRADLNIFNSDSGLITSITHVYEITNVGVFFDTPYIYSYPIFYSTTRGATLLVFLGPFYLVTLYYIVTDALSLIRLGAKVYFHNFERLTLIPERVLCVTVVVLFVVDLFARQEMVETVQTTFFTDDQHEHFINFDPVAHKIFYVTFFCSTLAMTSFVRVMYRLYHVKTLQKFLMMIPPVAQLLFIPAFIMLLFATWGFLLFQSKISDFYSFKQSTFTLTIMVFKARKLIIKISNDFPIMGPIFFTFTFTIIYYFILNFFITCMNEAYYEINQFLKYQAV